MPHDDTEELRTLWNRQAADWRLQVGDEGDRNRRLNSDPVLWEMAGPVGGLRVLDAGCGTGYLCHQLHARGARVTGVDFAERMIEQARAAYPGLEFHVDSCAELRSQPDAAFDLVVANYVLMDTPELDGTLRAFRRVLKPGGAALVVFSHPCFPQAYATLPADDGPITYAWPFPYFEESKQLDEPWAHFTHHFVWYHRPLSDYWKAFHAAGFVVEAFDEPRITPEREPLLDDPARLRAFRERPYSVAFRLRASTPPAPRP